MNDKTYIAIVIVFISVVMVTFLAGQSLLLSLLLLLLFLAKHKLMPIKREGVWFVLAVIGGFLIETILVNYGNAWSYSMPYTLGVPIYAPLFWGLMITTVISLYERQHP